MPNHVAVGGGQGPERKTPAHFGAGVWKALARGGSSAGTDQLILN